MRVSLICLCVLCVASAMAYFVGRGEKMRAESGGVGCFTSEGYVLWNGVRAITHGADPYSSQVTAENELYLYNSPAKARGLEPQRFAYPLLSVTPLLLIGWMGFKSASWVLLVLFATIFALWVGWLRALWDERTFVYTVLIFGSYPAFYDFASLQPVVLALGLAIAGLYAVRSGHFAGTTVLFVVSMIKPQIAAPILLPVLVGGLELTKYRRFLVWLALAGAAFASIAELLRSGWIRAWLAAARDYASYSPKPMAYGWFGAAAPVVSALIFVALVAVLWLCRSSDLIFRVSLSVVALYPLLPYRSYNAVVFMIPLVWLADNVARVEAGGALQEIALGFSRVAVVTLWVFTAIGAALLWSKAWKIGFMLPIAALHILYFSLCAVMLLQCLSVLRDAGRSGRVASSTIPDSAYCDLPNSTATLSE